MNIKHILLTAAALAMALTLAGCDKDKYGKVEQGRVIAFDKDKKEVTVIHDSAMDPRNPVYDVLPPAVFKLPVDPKETGAVPKVGQRLKLDTEKKEIEIYDFTTQKLAFVPITIVDLQQPVDKEHPLVYDKATKKAKTFPVVDQEKRTITVYSGRQKMLCTFTVPDNYFAYPESTWDAGDEVRIYFKTAGQALRFMNVSKTDIFKK